MTQIPSEFQIGILYIANAMVKSIRERQNHLQIQTDKLYYDACLGVNKEQFKDPFALNMSQPIAIAMIIPAAML